MSTKKTKKLDQLSRRERQIMEILFRSGEATVTDVQSQLKDELNYSSVRAFMGILETKGHLKHRKEGRAFVYSPTLNRKKASHQALSQVVQTFFDGSVENVVATLVNLKSSQLSDEELDKLEALIKEAREKENKS